MKARRGQVPGQGACEYYWDGANWSCIIDNCSPQACNAPTYLPIGQAPFYQWVQCVPARGEPKPVTVRINVTSGVDICLIHVPACEDHRAADARKHASGGAKVARKRRVPVA